MKYEINVTTRTKPYKRAVGIIKEEVKEDLLKVSNFEELKNIFSKHRAYLKDTIGVELYPESIRDRCEIIQKIKDGKAHEIKANPRLAGMFIKITVEF